MSWKQNGDYPESMYGIAFREKYPDIARELSVGINYDFTKSFTKDGYTYKAKQVTAKKDGKQYIFVERVKADSKPDPSEGARKGHAENVKMHEEHIAIMRETNTNIKNLNESIIALLDELRKQENQKK